MELNIGVYEQVKRTMGGLLAIWTRICPWLLAGIWGICLWGASPASAAWAADYNKEFLVGMDFSQQDLTDSTFTSANLRNSNLSGSNLQGVSLFGANLESADLSGADLRNALIDNARLTHANLTNAILEGASAANARFNGATIAGADFTDVLMRPDMEVYLCGIATGTNPVTGRQTRDTLYCE